MRKLALFLLLTTVAALAAKKPDLTDYQDAVLVSFKDVHTGSSCNSSGNVNAKADANGNVNGTTSSTTNCADGSVRQYSITVGSNSLTLERTFSKKQVGTALATAGFSAFFIKQSVLANLLPGTHILVRSDADGVYVKVGKKESRYDIVAGN